MLHSRINNFSHLSSYMVLTGKILNGQMEIVGSGGFKAPNYRKGIEICRDGLIYPLLVNY